MDGQRENSIPTTNKVCGGYKYTYLIMFIALSIAKIAIWVSSKNWISHICHNGILDVYFRALDKLYFQKSAVLVHFVKKE